MNLPRTYRTYFDPHCSEYTWISDEQKLLEIGRAIMHGFDLHECVREILQSHSHVSEDNVHLGVCNLISAVTGGSTSGHLLLRRNNSIDTDIELLICYLMRRYRVRYQPDTGHYLADDTNQFSSHELDEINGWRVAAGQVDWYQLYKYGNFVAYPGDADLLREYNLRAEGRNKGFVSYIVPEPWYGSPVSANVVILGGAPRYDDFVSRIANQVFQNPRLVEEVSVRLFDDYRGWWWLSGGGFYDTYDLSNFVPPVRPMDMYNSPTYRHWLDQFRRWASWFKVNDQEVMNNVAVINATAYLSVDDEPLAAGLLPSHYFLLHLVRYIFFNNPETIFVIPSEKLYAVWQKILGDSMTLIMAFKRVLILSKDNPRLNLSPRFLSEKEKDLLKARISGK